MKKIILLLSFICAFALADAQSFFTRSQANHTVQDSRFAALYNLVLPRYADTTQANTLKGLDSCGAMIFIRSTGKVFVRECNPKKWAEFAGSYFVNGDTTIFAVILDSTGQPNDRLLFSRNNKVSSNPTLLVDSTNNRLIINNSNVSVGGTTEKLYVNGNTTITGATVLKNTIASTVGSQLQQPPVFSFYGSGWSTATSTNIAQTLRLYSQVSTSTGSSRPIFYVDFQNNLGTTPLMILGQNALGGAYFPNSGGRFQNMYVNNNGITSGDTRLYLNSAANTFNADQFIYNQAGYTILNVNANSIGHEFKGGYGAPGATNAFRNIFASFAATENWHAGSTGSYEGMRLNITETVIPSGQNYLFRAGTGGTSFVSKVDITNSGQLLVGNSVTPVAGSLLNVSSTTQGALLPRMTTAQKTAIAAPAEGLEVYDLTLHQKSYYNGTTWVNY